MIVVKLGGSEGVDVDGFCRDAAGVIHSGTRMVIVHGGSHATNQLAAALGHPPQFVTSPSGHTSRRTDRRTLDIFSMACALLNQSIVEQLQRFGVRAIGLSGVDGRVWEGRRKGAIRVLEDGVVKVVRDDYTGTVDTVNVGLLRSLLDAGYTPVLAPPAMSVEGEPINVDADRAAAMTAAGLGAEALLLLSNVPGLLREFPNESTLISRVVRTDFARCAEYAQGRMKKKVLGAGEALDRGVARVVIGDARAGAPVTAALAGAGTAFE